MQPTTLNWRQFLANREREREKKKSRVSTWRIWFSSIDVFDCLKCPSVWMDWVYSTQLLGLVSANTVHNSYCFELEPVFRQFGWFQLFLCGNLARLMTFRHELTAIWKPTCRFDWDGSQQLASFDCWIDIWLCFETWIMKMYWLVWCSRFQMEMGLFIGLLMII